jgi:hypothetical protein
LPGLFWPEYYGHNEKITAKNIPTAMKKIQESTKGHFKYRSGVPNQEKPPMSILVRLPVMSLEFQRQSPRSFQ